MRYFVVKQDREIKNLIKLRDFTGSQQAIFTKEQQDQLNELSTLFVTGDEGSIYTDIITSPVLLISDALKKVFELYEHTIIYKTVVLSNIKEETQRVYHMALTDIIGGLRDQTVFYKTSEQKDLVLDGNKLQGHNIFQISKVMGHSLIVSLDVAESILRRDFIGISLQEIEVV